MRLRITSNITEAYKAHGFCVLVNKAIAIALQHYNTYGNRDIAIEDWQINELFDVHYKGDHDYTVDLVTFEGLEVNFGEYAFHEADSKDLQIKQEVLARLMTPKVIPHITGCELGVHARGTDKATEVKRVDANELMSRLLSYKDKSIFLATDDSYFSVPLMQAFPHIVRNNHTISTNGKPLHADYSNRSKVNKEVLADVLSLTKCEHLFYCYSHVSYLALCMGNYKSITNIN